MAFVFRGDKPQANNKPSNVGPGITPLTQVPTIFKCITRIKYPRHMSPSVAWSPSSGKAAMSWRAWSDPAPTTSTCSTAARRSSSPAKPRISRYWRYQGPTPSSSREWPGSARSRRSWLPPAQANSTPFLIQQPQGHRCETQGNEYFERNDNKTKNIGASDQHQPVSVHPIHPFQYTRLRI